MLITDGDEFAGNGNPAAPFIYAVELLVLPMTTESALA